MSFPDNDLFKRFLSSRGIIKDSFPVRYDFDSRKFNARRFEEPLRELTNNESMYTLIQRDGFTAPKLQVEKKLAEARSFETVDNRNENEEFIRDISAKGSAMEPIWGDNGKTTQPAFLLLPPWERLKVDVLKPIKNALWCNKKPFSEGFNNNLTCVCDGFFFMASLGSIQVTSIDELLNDGNEIHEKFEISLSGSYELYFQDRDELAFSNPVQHFEEDLEIHFIKVAKLYNRNVLCVCTESGVNFIFKVDDILSCRESSRGRDVISPIKLHLKPQILLNVYESCWSIDIYDAAPTKFIAVGHNRPGITIFAHQQRSHTLISCEIPVKHNVPTLDFVKRASSENGSAFLAYASIFGNVSTLKLDIDIGSGASLNINWEYLDTEFLSEWCWTVTSICKSDFHVVTEFEYLNNNFNLSHKSKYLSRAYQDSLILKVFPSSLSQSSHLGIGGKIAQIGVPVADLSFLNHFYNTTGRVALRFTTFLLPSSSEAHNRRYSEAYIRSECLIQGSSQHNGSNGEHGFALADNFPIGDAKVESGYAESQENWANYPLACDRYDSSVRTPFILDMRFKCEVNTSQITDPYKESTFEQYTHDNRSVGFITSEAHCTESRKCERFPNFIRGVAQDSSTHDFTWDREMQEGLSRDIPFYDYGSDSDQEISQEDVSVRSTISQESSALNDTEATAFDSRSTRRTQTQESSDDLLPRQDNFRVSNPSSGANSQDEAAFVHLDQSPESLGVDVGSLVQQIRRLFGDSRLIGLNGNDFSRTDRIAPPAFHPESLFNLGRATDAMRFWSVTNYINKVEKLLQLVDADTRYSSQGPFFKSSISNDTFFLVTTNSMVYLLNGDPLIITAFTSAEIFPISHVSSCRFYNHIERINRISLVCFIKELQLIVVASQLGLISLLRLTSYNGIHSFRQEYVFGWKAQNPLSSNAQCMSTFIRGEPIMNCREDDTIFEMYNISGMDYTFVPRDHSKGIPDHAILYVTSRDTINRFKIYK